MSKEDEVKAGDDKQITKEDTVTKVEFDALQEENAQLKKDNEESRLEVFTDDYMTYLDSKDKKVAPVDDKLKKEDVPLVDDSLDKMSKKDILAMATKNAEAAMKVQLDVVKKDQQDYRRSKVSETVREFAAGHTDYEQYRPIMFGLSKDPKNAKATLTQLYDMAIKHVKDISGISKEDKIKQIKSGGERPGGYSGSFQTEKILTADEASKEALAEVEEKLGSLPTF